MKSYETILVEMAQRYRELSGHAPEDASDIGIRLKVLAAQVWELWQRCDWMWRQLLPDTATGDYLEYHAATRGLTRKPAVRAVGTLTFSRAVQASYDTAIPAGTLCAIRGAGRYRTTEAGVIPAGSLSVTVAAEAEEGGEDGNASAGTVTLLVSPPAGITGVVNPGPFEGGADEESDDALRARLLASYQAISNGANAAFYYDEAMKVEGVGDCAVIPRMSGSGTVGVIVTGREGQLPEGTLQALEAHLDRVREIGVDVTVANATLLPQTVAIAIKPVEEDGYDALETAVETAVEAAFDGMRIGQPLLLGKLAGVLAGVPGLYNFAITAPAADQAADADERITLGTLTLSPLEVSV